MEYLCIVVIVRYIKPLPDPGTRKAGVEGQPRCALVPAQHARRSRTPSPRVGPLPLLLLLTSSAGAPASSCPASTPLPWARAAATLGPNCVVDGQRLRSKEVSAAVHLDGADGEETCGTMAVFLGGKLCGLATAARPWFPHLRGVVPDSGKRAFQVQCCDVRDDRGMPLRHHRMSVRFARSTREPVLTLNTHLRGGLAWDHGRAVPQDFMVQGLAIFTGVTAAAPRAATEPDAPQRARSRGSLSVYGGVLLVFLSVCLTFTYCAYRERAELVLPVSYKGGEVFVGAGKRCR